MDREDRLRAVEAAYASYADDVYRVAYAFLHDRDDAVDATQETFVRTFERWDRYDPERPLRPWLHAIVSRIALDQLRRRRVRWLAIPALGARQQTGDDPYSGRDPGPAIAQRHVVDGALASLQPTARAAVVLRHRYGYEYVEIAAFLGVSVSNVGAILTRARAHLRQQLDPTTSPVPEAEA